MGSKKAVICIHVFPALDYLEIVQLDSRQGNIDKAASLPGAFEPITRQIEDTDQLGQVVRDLYEGNRIPLTTPAILVLPSFFTREASVPKEFSREEQRTSLTAEAERFYIFKKNEPQLDWVTMTNERVLYTAFPKSEMERFTQVFQANKIPLQAIDLNYFSIVRGLAASGAINEELANKQKWGLLVVADYTFFGAVCEGGAFAKTVEAPISINANDPLSTIGEIQQDFDDFIEGEPITKLVLVNNSDRIDTEILSNRLSFQDQVLVIEQNAKTLRSRGEMDAMYPCSLEAIGGCLYNKYPDLPAVNLVPESAQEQVALVEAQEMLVKVLGVVTALVLVVCLGLWGLFSLFVMGKEAEVKGLSEQLAKLETGQSTNEVKRKRFIKQAMDHNKHANNILVKLGSAIPDELWVEDIFLEVPPNSTAEQVQVQGGALTPELVEQFLKDLKKETTLEYLEIGKVDRSTTSDGQSFYTWQIHTKGLSVDPTKTANATP